MNRKLISSGSEFESKMGYSRAVVDGDYVFVSGTTGYNYQEGRISEDVKEQADQCFKNIQAALQEAGSSIENAVRVTYIVPNRDDFEPCFPVLAKWLGEVRPAATVFEARLLDDNMKIEIQVTARLNG
ncbi:RidA family protein [Ketobacter sp. MCCC 1A13808]|uniref:RidA family protein n=1 Tax=Ketobacter sp. MCCC 1A13808 TaxID=2602738 RepID=UPI000F0EDBB3|nr:RidA family protein [Ketobacter sp. MCCC 1A13808]MVF14080.1 RidA family protein [Ketobacter sp. MCCC 1A13808]RLP55106.1 MAG: RidA family protein [Ketobacter sp.]